MSIFEKIISGFRKIADPSLRPKAECSPNPPTRLSHTANTQSPSEKSKIKNHRVTGTSHYESNILKLATENKDYAKTKSELIQSGLVEKNIYQYNFHPHKTELVPEPTNQYDTNAIKVIIDDQHVGYIKAGSCSHMLKLINENRIQNITSKINGGTYKCVIVNGGPDCDSYELIKEKSGYSITVTIIEV